MFPARDVVGSVRSAEGRRLFPGIAAEYVRPEKARGADQESAARLLGFVDRRFTFTQRVLGWNLDPETKLGRVLLLRRQAFEAERAAQFRKADFLWVEAHRALRHAAADEVVWRHALDISRFSPSITPAILRERFIRELFIDLHRAVFESLLAAACSPPHDHRLFVHCGFVETLVEIAGFDAPKAERELRPMFDKWLEAFRRAGAWKQGMALCSRLAEKLSPSSTYIDELVVCLLRQTFDRLTKPPASFGHEDDRHLEAAVCTLERAMERLGPTGLAMASLARLHQMRAIALSNTGDRAAALVEIAIALDHGGNEPQFLETLRELTQDPESALLPMRAYRASEAAVRTRETAAAVAAIDLWRRIGLPRPADAWPQRARALSDALAALARNPRGAGSIADAWLAVSAGNEALSGLPRPPIEAFLLQCTWSPRQNAVLHQIARPR